jgi:hypothetical protein
MMTERLSFDITTMKRLMKKGFCPFHPEVKVRVRNPKNYLIQRYEIVRCHICEETDQTLLPQVTDKSTGSSPPKIEKETPVRDSAQSTSPEKEHNNRFCKLHPDMQIVVFNPKYPLRKHFRPCERCLEANIVALQSGILDRKLSSASPLKEEFHKELIGAKSETEKENQKKTEVKSQAPAATGERRISKERASKYGKTGTFNPEDELEWDIEVHLEGKVDETKLPYAEILEKASSLAKKPRESEPVDILESRPSDGTFFISMEDDELGRATQTTLTDYNTKLTFSSPRAPTFVALKTRVGLNAETFQMRKLREKMQSMEYDPTIYSSILEGYRPLDTLDTEELMKVLEKDTKLKRYIGKFRAHGLTGFALSEGIYRERDLMRYFWMSKEHAVYLLAYVQTLKELGVSPNLMP